MAFMTVVVVGKSDHTLLLFFTKLCKKLPGCTEHRVLSLRNLFALKLDEGQSLIQHTLFNLQKFNQKKLISEFEISESLQSTARSSKSG